MYDFTAKGKILTQKSSTLTINTIDLSSPPPRNCVLKIENFVIETQNKLFICPYFRKEGGGQEGYQNVLIFYVLIRGRREGSK